MKNKIQNRGTHLNIAGRFETETHEIFYDDWHTFADLESLPTLETSLFPDKTKSIITRNDSPDIGFEQSINPYKGCEHGCVYCYARPSHAYLNLSPGLDFESKIFYKSDAASLFEKEITKANYQCKTVVIGANTDPYQPAEGKLKITQSLLEIALKYQHPIAIITKGSLIERDIPLLQQLAALRLAHVAITITTLSPELKRILEPRAAAAQARLRVIHKLNEVGVPVTVMAAPMIPMVNDKELEHILKAAQAAGARNAGYTLIRLPYEVKTLFKEWLQNHYPDRAAHVMSIIKQMRGGKEYDATFGKRMRGEGEFAELLAMRFKLACKRYQLNKTSSTLDTSILKKQVKLKQTPQLDLFDASFD